MSKDNESTLFRQAMEGVKPLGKGSKAPADDSPRPRKKSPAREPQRMALSGNALKQFDDRRNAPTVDGNSSVEFFQRSVPYRERSRLKKGQIDIEASLDLHGMTLETARHAFSVFLNEAQTHHWRCIKIIHGKGHHDAPPVLKNAVCKWLPQSPAVLGYASARAKEGGTGAILVLLKKQN
jgi:DNA-nicking Smr family endonuclease